jgi:uncharacterized protein YbjT (DUF2867 family)
LTTRPAFARRCAGATRSSRCSSSAASAPDGETGQGRSVIDAALCAQITHLVYSSAGGANRHSGIPHFESKAEIERHLAASGIPYTILRPAFFMTNYERQRDTILAGTLQLPLPRTGRSSRSLPTTSGTSLPRRSATPPHGPDVPSTSPATS